MSLLYHQFLNCQYIYFNFSIFFDYFYSICRLFSFYYFSFAFFCLFISNQYFSYFELKMYQKIAGQKACDLIFSKMTSEYELNSCQNKDIINSFNSCFIIFIFNTNDDIQLTGSLVNHLNINLCMC